ncbi:MAG: hypothetical protein H7841_03340 [Magnetospirillum sp. WYHS-4]
MQTLRHRFMDPDMRDSAMALIQEHGRHAYRYALDRAAQIRARGNAAVSLQWSALAAAIGDMTHQGA